jgi:hypothetical protein
MPGFSVDQNGRVMFNEREIKYVMINGEDITGNRYEVITKNLQAGLISKVELVKRFYENRLHSSVSSGEEQAINLVVDEHRKNKLNAQYTIGISPDIKRNEMEGNMISLYQRATTLMVFDFNNAGRNTTGSEQSGNIQSNAVELFKLPYSYVPAYVSASIPDTYLRNGSVKSYNINHAHKWNQHLSFKLHLNELIQRFTQQQNSMSSFVFPGMDEFKYQNNLYHQNDHRNMDAHVEIKYDNLKRHISAYQVNVKRSSQSRSDLQYSTLPIFDTMRILMAGTSRTISIKGIESFQFHGKYVLESESNLTMSKPDNELHIASHSLQFLPGKIAGSSILLDHAAAAETMFITGLRLLLKLNKRYVQWGIKYVDQYLQTTNNIDGFASKDSARNINSIAGFHSKRIFLYGKWEHEINKHLTISFQSSLGETSSFWQASNMKKITGNAMMFLNYRKHVFRQTNIYMNVSRASPNKQIYFSSMMLNEQMQFMNGSSNMVFPITTSVRVTKTYNDLYKGYSITSNASIDKNMLTVIPTYNQYPFYSIHGYEVGKGGILGSISGKIQKNIFRWKLKPFLDMHLNRISQHFLFNGYRNQIKSMVSEVQVGTISYWNTKVNVEFTTMCRSTQMNIKPEKENANIKDVMLTTDLKFKYEIAKDTYASIYGIVLMNKQYKTSTTFLDAYAEHKVSERIMLLIKAHNLLNQKEYSERRYSPYFIQSTGMSIAPRYLMFSVQIGF